jgi:mannose-6-phosphate isomerase-like protein (cupin superfamily)
MSERIEKPWGWSQEVYRCGRVSLSRIYVKPGGFCSWHKHASKANRFFVESGTLTIEEIEVIPVETKIGDGMAGNEMVVPPGRVHRFINETGSEVYALEIYTTGSDKDPPDSNDIVRFSEGGVAKQ